MSVPLHKRVKRGVIGRIVLALVWIIRKLPRRAAHAVGEWGGLLAWSVSIRDRWRIDRHLALVYGEAMTATERSALGKRFFIHSGRNLIDVARIATHLKSELLPRVEYVDFHHWECAMKRGKGVIGLTGHLGNFELLAAVVHARTGQIAVIGRELSNVQLNKLMLSSRESAGLVNFLTTDSPRKLIKWLRNGGAIGVLIDTDSNRVRGELLPFMGRLSNTPIGHAAIALAAGAAIVPMTCIRSGADSYQVIARPEIQMQPTGNREEDIRELTRLCNVALEELVLAYPDQWIWLHNRWHTRPGERTVLNAESITPNEHLSEPPMESI